MSIAEIIRLFDNPATFDEALKAAAALPFKGDDGVRFKQKQQKYIDGLSPDERPHWAGEMKNFLSQYSDEDLTPRAGAGNYKADTFNRWHYLDKQTFRKSIKDICRDRDTLVKVLFIEDNTDAFSDHTDEILLSWIKEDHKAIHNTLTATKGAMNDVFFLESHEQVSADWEDFMEKHFGLSPSETSIAEQFRQAGFHRSSHIIVHSIEPPPGFFVANFQHYYSLWCDLSPEQPIFLCLYLPEHSLPKEASALPHSIHCYCDKYEPVRHEDFTRFFKDYKCYQRDEALCKCDSMCFSEAVKKLHYCQPGT